MNRLPTRRTSRGTLRRAGAAGAGLLLALSLAACGGDDADSDSDDTGDSSDDTSETSDAPSEDTDDTEESTAPAAGSPLSEEQALSILLTADDVPDTFTAGEDDDDTEAPGCLEAIDDLEDVDSEAEAKTTFDLESDAGAAGVLSRVDSYADEETITTALAALRDSLASCTSVEESEDDGSTLSLQVVTDDEVTTDVADEQLNLNATGEVTGGDQTFPYTVSYAVSRVSNNLVVVGVYEVGADSGTLGQLGDLNTTVTGRLADLLGG